MGRFWRTIVGKALMILLLNVSALLLAASVTGALICISQEMYGRTETEYMQDEYAYTACRQACVYASDVLQEESMYGQIRIHEMRLQDVSGTELARTPAYEEAAADKDSVHYVVGLFRQNGTIQLAYSATNPENEKVGLPSVVEYVADVWVPLQQIESSMTGWEASVQHLLFRVRYLVYPLGLLALLGSIALYVALLYGAGRTADRDGFVPGPFQKVPYDLILLGSLGLASLYLYAWEEAWGTDLELICAGVGVVLGLNTFLALSMSFASRVKQHALVRYTLIWQLLRLIWRIFCTLWSGIRTCVRAAGSFLRQLPLVWKTLLGLGVLCFIRLLILTNYNFSGRMLGWIIETVAVSVGVLYLALCLRRLQKSGRALAYGDLEYRTDTRGLPGNLKKHGEDLNRISEGMSQAVEQRLKSERMKTELITNVSHDLKTPLTSVINYAGLIAQEPTENPQIREYSEVLVRQSDKLKRLIEDLVEASKASSGNLEVKLESCDAAVFLTQAGGEYQEKLEAAGLTLITKVPEQEIRIMADSRRMWRIFDNLMNNICKYSQSGTRVYLSLKKLAGTAVITFKNTSRDSLDISEEELMERFVRGDTSRNTEGNGLGLSIARSLAELQNGKLLLKIDGDLFKVRLEFPAV